MGHRTQLFLRRLGYTAAYRRIWTLGNKKAVDNPFRSKHPSMPQP